MIRILDVQYYDSPDPAFGSCAPQMKVFVEGSWYQHYKHTSIFPLEPEQQQHFPELQSKICNLLPVNLITSVHWYPDIIVQKKDTASLL